MPVFPFFLIFFAYHSDMMLIKGANSNVGLLAVNAVGDRNKAHVVPSEYLRRVAGLRSSCPQRGRSFIISVMRITSRASM